MLPYILGGAAALALLGGTKLRRKKRHHGDPRTAATQRIRIVDSRHAKTLRMARANPSRTVHHRGFDYILVASSNAHGQRTWIADIRKDGQHVYDFGMGGLHPASKKSAHRLTKIWIGRYIKGEVKTNPRVATTHIEFVIQGNYGYGWDDENTELNWKDAKRSIREYRENGGGSYRMIKRRVKNDATNPRSAWGPDEHTFHIDVPGGILAAYWFDDGRWLLRYKGEIVARGTDYRPAPAYRKNDKKAGCDLISLAMAALPGSGSGIAGDEDSLKAWTKEGVKLLDKSSIHDAVSIETDTEVNPKRRGKKGRKAKWTSPGNAAARLAWWRWHHNPGSAPKGYKSATGRRLGRMLHFGEPPISALRVAKVVARQNGDHVAYEVIRSALVAASANRSLPQAVTIARRAARLLGYRGKWRA